MTETFTSRALHMDHRRSAGEPIFGRAGSGGLPTAGSGSSGAGGNALAARSRYDTLGSAGRLLIAASTDSTFDISASTFAASSRSAAAGLAAAAAGAGAAAGGGAPSAVCVAPRCASAILCGSSFTRRSTSSSPCSAKSVAPPSGSWFSMFFRTSLNA